MIPPQCRQIAHPPVSAPEKKWWPTQRAKRALLTCTVDNTESISSLVAIAKMQVRQRACAGADNEPQHPERPDDAHHERAQCDERPVP
jgi:hypothetical protein